MIQQVKRLNNLSAVCYLLSSLSLIGIPFLNFQTGMPFGAYVIAVVFWLGALLGTIFQIIISRKFGKINADVKQYNKKLMNILTDLFLVLFVLLIIFKKESTALLSVDLACLLLSVEIKFYLKWRNIE